MKIKLRKNLRRGFKGVAKHKEVDNVVHVMILDAEVLSRELVGPRVHDGQLEAAQAGRTDFVLHPDNLEMFNR